MPTKEQIEKLNNFTKIASEAVRSEDFVVRLGGLSLYAGLVDFMAIQSARLIEQVIIKGNLKERGEPCFTPHDDEYFYDEQISTRRILHVIKNLLPFKTHSKSSPASSEKELSEINDGVKDYLKKANTFLNYRNTILHHIGNPKKSGKDIEEIADKAIVSFESMKASHEAFFEKIRPYRFSSAEIKKFYGK